MCPECPPAAVCFGEVLCVLAGVADPAPNLWGEPLPSLLTPSVPGFRASPPHGPCARWCGWKEADDDEGVRMMLRAFGEGAGAEEREGSWIEGSIGEEGAEQGRGRRSKAAMPEEGGGIRDGERVSGSVIGRENNAADGAGNDLAMRSTWRGRRMPLPLGGGGDADLAWRPGTAEGGWGEARSSKTVLWAWEGCEEIGGEGEGRREGVAEPEGRREGGRAREGGGREGWEGGVEGEGEADSSRDGAGGAGGEVLRGGGAGA